MSLFKFTSNNPLLLTLGVTLGLGLFTLGLPLESYAFQTANVIGNPIHEQITRILIAKDGFTESTCKKIIVEVNNQDNLGSAAFNDPGHHFDDNYFAQGSNIIFLRSNDIVSLAQTARQNPAVRKTIYAKLGEIFHAAQDFYSHSNFIELQLKQGVNPNSLQTVSNWTNVGLAQTQFGAQLHTGYFYYDSWHSNEIVSSVKTCVDGLILKWPGLSNKLKQPSEYCPFMKCDDSKQAPTTYLGFQQAIDNVTGPKFVLHYFQNKDDVDSIMGKVLVPGTNKTMHNLAMEVAAKDTARLWEDIEARIRTANSSDPAKAIAILKALKTDTNQ